MAANTQPAIPAFVGPMSNAKLYAGTTKRRYGKSQFDLDWLAGQTCDFQCGRCDLRFTGTLEEWLPLRDQHFRSAHKMRTRKRKPLWLVQREEAQAVA